MSKESMPENLTPQQRAFKEHLEKMKGQPFSPLTTSAVQAEIAQGAKGGYAVSAPEKSRAEVLSGYPTGELLSSKKSEAQLEDEILRLGVARKAFNDFLENPTLSDFTSVREMTLEDLISKERELQGDMIWAITTIAEHDIDIDEKIMNIPNEINKLIKKYTAIVEESKRKKKRSN